MRGTNRVEDAVRICVALRFCVSGSYNLSGFLEFWDAWCSVWLLIMLCRFVFTDPSVLPVDLYTHGLFIICFTGLVAR